MSKRTAIYGRMSTEDQAGSTEVQLQGINAAIEANGWEPVSKRLMFLDEAISREEFKKRPEFDRLLQAAELGAFDVLVIQDMDRLGAGPRLAVAVQDLIEWGVWIHTTADNKTYKEIDEEVMLIVGLKSGMGQAERRKIAMRGRTKSTSLFKLGRVAGGRVYGYENRFVPTGGRAANGKELGYTVRAPHIEQAKTLVRIFTLGAEGLGLRGICKILTDAGVPPPGAAYTTSDGAKVLARKGAARFWNPTAILPMFDRNLYRGLPEHDKTTKGYKGGTKVRMDKDESEWLRAEHCLDLQIISDELWDALKARRVCRKRVAGKKGRQTAPKYLLGGLAECGECGGPMRVQKRKHGKRVEGKQQHVPSYMCKQHRDLGDSVCTNSLGRPVAEVDAAVREMIGREVISEDIVNDTLGQVRSGLREQLRRADAETPVLTKRLREVDEKISNLTTALAEAASMGVSLKAVIQSIADLEKTKTTLDARVAILRATPGTIEQEIKRLEKEAALKVRALSSRLDGDDVDATREVLRVMILGRFVLTPMDTDDGRRYAISVDTAAGSLFMTEGWAYPPGTAGSAGGGGAGGLQASSRWGHKEGGTQAAGVAYLGAPLAASPRGHSLGGTQDDYTAESVIKELFGDRLRGRKTLRAVG